MGYLSSWVASQATLECIRSYTGVTSKLQLITPLCYREVPIKLHWSASKVPIGYLPSDTGVFLKLHRSTFQVTQRNLSSYTGVPPNLHCCPPPPRHPVAPSLPCPIASPVLQTTPKFSEFSMSSVGI